MPSVYARAEKGLRFFVESVKPIKTRGALIPVDPPCANYQFAATEGRELTCGDFHARGGISAAAGPLACSSLRLSPPPLPLRASFAIPNSLTARGMPPCGFGFFAPSASRASAVLKKQNTPASVVRSHVKSLCHYKKKKQATLTDCRAAHAGFVRNANDIRHRDNSAPNG